MENLITLSSLIKKRNKIEKEIAVLIDRPSMIGHVGEYIAAQIFHINLAESASNKGIDGYFTEENLFGKSVNIKYYTKNQHLLDITPDFLPDYYLVLSGPKSKSLSSRGQTTPWIIDSVYLFDAKSLVDKLKERNVKIGVATSIMGSLWDTAEIYPKGTNTLLCLSSVQLQMIELFKD